MENNKITVTAIDASTISPSLKQLVNSQGNGEPDTIAWHIKEGNNTHYLFRCENEDVFVTNGHVVKLDFVPSHLVSALFAHGAFEE